MDETAKDGRSSTQKTPEQIRAERIAAIADPKLRQELDGLVKTREAHLAEVRDRQKETFDSRVAQLAQQKINSANAPQLTPSAMRPTPFLGTEGQARAHEESDHKVKSLDIDYRNKIAKEHNDHIDKRLDAARENQIVRTPPDREAADSDRGPAPRSQGPNRYAELIKAQNYTERAKRAEADREKERNAARKPQRDLDR
jgi:hypothetical protein